MNNVDSLSKVRGKKTFIGTQYIPRHIPKNIKRRDEQILDVIGESSQLFLRGNKLENEVNEDQGKAYPDEVNFQVEDEDGKYFYLVL